ncbi:hypothetical protein DFH08DRAFT_517435 [Mycena albidolilacea]|uniref:DUF6534 domain-containing protein n=1 Tax=Mycena albidolilacea TaxID=1033008 RepID=A0AAD7E9S5_9AGAR|nr:hypothetical protein DFH08DRAFT_517435 [Mycena albidolilacea]
MSVSISLALHHSAVPLGSLLGPWLIGLVVSSIVFGITCLQVYLYYTKFSSRDSLFMKVFVAVLMILDIVHATLLTISYYVTSVDNFGDFEAISTAPCSFPQWPVYYCFVILFHSQGTDRGWSSFEQSSPDVLCLSDLDPVKQITLVARRDYILHFRRAVLCYSMVKSLQALSFKLQTQAIPFSLTALTFETACNILISGSMVYLLARNRTGFSKTNRAVNTLIAYMLNSGLLVAIFAVSCIVTFLTSTTTLIYGIFFFILVRLYGCSFMSIE